MKRIGILMLVHFSVLFRPLGRKHKQSPKSSRLTSRARAPGKAKAQMPSESMR